MPVLVQIPGIALSKIDHRALMLSSARESVHPRRPVEVAIRHLIKPPKTSFGAVRAADKERSVGRRDRCPLACVPLLEPPSGMT
jgi:hypothetical protein